MSMWEIEGLGEIAVQLVAGCADLSPAERRTYYAAIYGLQGSYDCSYTHFRCHEPLMRDGFLHAIQLEQHPAYEAQQAALEAATQGGEAWLPMDPANPNSPSAGLYCDGPSHKEDPAPGIYFDVTQPLWTAAKDAGHVPALEGPAFEEWEDVPALLNILTLAAARVESAEGPEERELARAVLKGFYGFAAMHCSWVCPPPSADNEQLAALFANPVLKEALTEPTMDWVDERFPVPTLPKPDESGMSNPEHVALWRTPLDGR
jgi:hypothetical protein